MLEWDSEHGSMGDYPGPHAVLKGSRPAHANRLGHGQDIEPPVACPGGAESLATRLAAHAQRRGVQAPWQPGLKIEMGRNDCCLHPMVVWAWH